MVNDRKNNITSKQMMSFIVSAQIGFGIISLPSVLAETVGHDGWISVLCTGIICTLSIYFLVAFLNRYSNKSIFQINIFLYGKLLGMFLNIILFIYIFFATSIISRTFVEIIKITVLKNTPAMAISVISLFPTIYMSLKGLKVLGRFTTMLFFSYIATLIFYLSIYKHYRITFIMPVGVAGVPLISRGMLLTGFSYLGFELITIIYPYVTDKDKAAKYAVLANVFTTSFFTLVVFLLTIIIGEEKLRMSTFPLFHVATSIKVPIFERVDLFFIMAWFPVMGSAVRGYFYCSYHFLDIVFDIQDNKMLIIIYAIFIFLLGRIPKDFITINKLSNIVGMSGIVVVTFLLFSFIFSFINKRGVVVK